MEERDSLQEYEEKSPYYSVNNARMRNDGNSYRDNPVVRKTLFVEGSDDCKFFRGYLKDGFKWNVKIANKKKGVLENYSQYKKLPTDEGTFFFCADMDYENVVETLLGRNSRVVDDGCFFYQLYDVEANRGFNDLESCLFFTDAYRNVMTEFYDDDRIITSIRRRIMRIGTLMGSYRVANILVRETKGLPDGSSMLCHRRAEKKENADEELETLKLGITPGAKFGVCFMNVFHLVDGRNLFVPKDDLVDNALLTEFGLEEFGNYLTELVGLAAGIRSKISENRSVTFSFLRGHDLMELLALRLLADGKMHLKGERQWTDPIPFARRCRKLEEVRDELESKFRMAAGSSLDEIRKFPIGKILK